MVSLWWNDLEHHRTQRDDFYIVSELSHGHDVVIATKEPVRRTGDEREILWLQATQTPGE
jgi:hypothetical protein